MGMLLEISRGGLHKTGCGKQAGRHGTVSSVKEAEADYFPLRVQASAVPVMG